MGASMEIKSLGYLGINSKDPLSWLKFSTEILGMMPARAVPGESWGMPADPDFKIASKGTGIADDGSVYLKLDKHQWRVGVHPSKEEGIAYVGFEVESETKLLEAIESLESQGIKVTKGSEEDANSRAVTGLARLEDPAGNQVELFYEPTIDYKFSSPIPDQEFVADRLGLGHLMVYASDLVKTYDFYTKTLGFKLSDYISYLGGDGAWFVRCNPRHHSIALAKYGDVNGVHHIMFELNTIDDVGKAYDRAKSAGIEISASIGRHINDGAFSFYMKGPDGWDIEVGAEVIKIYDDDLWTPNQFVEGDTWGHHGIMESVEEVSLDQKK